MQVVADSDVELVVAHGGDGTMLSAEREFPSVPKLLLRDFRTAPQCEEHGYRNILQNFVDGKLKLAKLPKLIAVARNERFIAINDIFIHNYEPMNALRYRVRINEELYANEVVGDGIGISSVHGSTAYYRSITHSLFRVGIGLAFSNSTEEVNHLVLNEKSQVNIEIVRGPGILVADNSPEQLPVKEGDVVKFFQSGKNAEIWNLKDFMCPKCRVLRHPNKLPFNIWQA